LQILISAFICAELKEETGRIMSQADNAQSKSEMVIENVQYRRQDIEDDIAPKVRELQDLSDHGLAAVANAGEYFVV
jgi:hypothetical protein